MSWQDVLAALSNKIGKNVDQSLQPTKDVTQQMLDRVKMVDNPSQQGPQLPPTQTPQEQSYNSQLPAAMAGALQNISGAYKFLPETAKELAAREMTNTAMETGAAMPMVQQAQQNQSRVTDFADRFKQAYQNMKKKNR